MSAETKKIPCYAVYGRKKYDPIIFKHSQMVALQNHVGLLLDGLREDESVQIVFKPMTEAKFDDLEMAD